MTFRLLEVCNVIFKGQMHLMMRRINVHAVLSLPDGSPLADGSPSHCACVTLRHCRLLSTAKPRMRHNDRSIFNHGGKKRRKPVLSKHDHLFKNEEDVVTVDKTDEVEDSKSLSPVPFHMLT